jgi:hypothetical protein
LLPASLPGPAGPNADREVVMALTGDHYVGGYEGHTLEILRNNWNKTVKLLIDGAEVDRASCLFPGRLKLTGSLEHNGGRQAVVATSVPHRLVFTKEALTVDGLEVPLTYEKPRGLLRDLFQDARQGDFVSAALVGAIGVSLLALAGAVFALLLR